MQEVSERREGLAARVRGRLAIMAGMFGALSVMAFMVMGEAANATTTTTPATVDDGFTQLNDKITTYGGSIVALVVLAAGIFIGVKYLKKGLSKA